MVDMPSMPDQGLHVHGKSQVNTNDGVQLELERIIIGSGNVKCHVFVISDSQLNLCSIDKRWIQNHPFNALSLGLTNSGKFQFVVD